ncbi:MAG: DUF512 domain-containing protein [Eubacteriales bacterium]|nr:DUF512 domain-containing protein [Eubacteriales bacterium]
MKEKKHIISKVAPGSIAWEMEIEPGDELLSVNGEEIKDILDYRYLCNEEELTVLIRKANGEEWEIEIEKEFEEDLGLEFENEFMDDYRSCRNKCIFCFIDQMPPGMRETLYFKDDDSRLSFLQGNYVTLTNLSDGDMERIIRYHLSPINISFQTMNPKLRCRMLNNRFAGSALKKADRLAEAGIEMNGQIVLCKGINDGEELENSIRELTKYIPQLASVSVVPVGLTKYRDGLYPLTPFDREDACRVLDTIHCWQKKLYQEYGTHFIHAGDEWYLLAGRELPPKETYDGYLQLENGVGMLRLFLDETKEAVRERTGDGRRLEVSVATGILAAPYISHAAGLIQEKFPGVQVHVYPVENRFFGERITVAGLLTGQDLMEALKGQPLGERLLLTCSMFRSGEKVFLDDVSLEELETALQTPACIVQSSGKDFVRAVLSEEQEAFGRGVQKYEVKKIE